MGRGTAELVRELVVGETRQLTAAALGGAVALFGVAAAVEYVALSNVVAGSETNPYFDVRYAFTLAPVAGYLLAGAVSAAHAYFNEGYLPSLALALAPSSGVAAVTIHGIDEYVTFVPGAISRYVLPEGLLVGTVGFLLGLGLRYVRPPRRLVPGTVGQTNG